MNATLNGLSTIRAYGAQKILQQEFDKSQDVHTSSWYIFIAASSTFGFALDIFCFIFTSIVIFSFLVVDNGIEFLKKKYSVVLHILIVFYSSQITQEVMWDLP